MLTRRSSCCRCSFTSTDSPSISVTQSCFHHLVHNVKSYLSYSENSECHWGCLCYWKVHTAIAWVSCFKWESLNRSHARMLQICGGFVRFRVQCQCDGVRTRPYRLQYFSTFCLQKMGTLSSCLSPSYWAPFVNRCFLRQSWTRWRY